jgi:hypothetical protein
MKIRHAFGVSLAICLISTVHAHQALDDKLHDIAINQDVEVEVAEVQASIEEDFVKLDNMVQQPTKDFNFYYTKYPYEMYCIGVFVLMAFWLVIGKQKTLSMAQKWHNKTLPLLKNNFAYVGVTDG